ncbi:MAG: DNA/RNA nuclease SfsA [Firmicutes bacterium]|nr:DNA/RNA nuclease SfsA [Bacillota bacterium]
MNYENIVFAKFIDRPNRFVAHVDLDGQTETVHVKNTGRCRELLLPGSTVVLAKAANPARKTKYDLIAVIKEGLGWVNIDSQVPNACVKEWLEAQKNESDIRLIKPEYKFGNSRVDFYLECGEGDDLRKILIEVKGCTLEIDGIGYFPDAPTERGVKHLNELAGACGLGYECYIAFVIAMPSVTEVKANYNTHPEFGYALEAAKAAGVKVLFLPCSVEPSSIQIVQNYIHL